MGVKKSINWYWGWVFCNFMAIVIFRGIFWVSLVVLELGRRLIKGFVDGFIGVLVVLIFIIKFFMMVVFD